MANSLSPIVYECYKPTNLEEAREYIEYLLYHTKTLANEVSDLAPKRSKAFFGLNLSQHIDFTPSVRLQEYLNTSYSDKCYLKFDSNFECGNLERAVAKSELEYDLYVNSDTNACNRRQWFYFSVGNTRKGSTVKFNIVNLTKYHYFLK